MKTLNFAILLLVAIGAGVIVAAMTTVGTGTQYANAQVRQNNSCAPHATTTTTQVIAIYAPLQPLHPLWYLEKCIFQK